MEKRQWIIWSIEHRGWWKPNWRGYTEERDSAGKYTFAEARKIVKIGNIGNRDIPNEAMIEFIPPTE